MIQITPSNFNHLQSWYNNATATKSVKRFLSIGKFISYPKIENYTSDWECVSFLSSSEKTLLIANIDRETSDISISIWSLASGMQKKLESGRAMILVKNELITAYGANTISAAVHSSNEESLQITSKIFGDPWGIRPESAWDRKLGCFVDLHYFQIKARS